MSGLRSPQSHTERCMSKKAAIQFIGIFFFPVCVCIAFFPLLRALLAQRPAPSLQSLAGQQHREEEDKIRGGAGPAPRQRPECHPGRCKSGRCELQRHGGGGVHCNIFELFPPTPAAGVASASRLLIAAQNGLQRLGTRAAPALRSISCFLLNLI